MDVSPFQLDIDELIYEFAKREMKTVADMKVVWLERKFTYIFEARPSTNLTAFMQSLYDYSISHLDSANSLSQRLDAKRNGITVASSVVKRMLEKNAFLFGSVNLNEYSDKEKIKELVDVQKACIQNLNTKLFKETKIGRHLHMDLGMELDQKVFQKMSDEYAATKTLGLKEASGMMNVQDIQHIAEARRAIVDEMQEIIEEWDAQKVLLAQLTRSNKNHVEPQSEKGESSTYAICAPASPVLNAEDEEWLYDDNNLIQNRSFTKMLLDTESPQGKAYLRNSKEEHQDDSEFVMELEEQLIEDAP